MTRRIDVAAILAAADRIEAGHELRGCNSRCQARGECTFRNNLYPGTFCRERRPPRRSEMLQLDAASG